MAKSYMEWNRNYYYNLLRYGLKLSPAEIKGSLATIGISAFVFSFRQWGGDTFDFFAGITNFLIAAVAAAIALFLFQLGQRLIAIYYGYDPEYESSSIGLMLSMIIAFASRGYLIVVMPGYVVINMLAASRLGEFRYYTNLWEWAKSLVGGPLFNFLAACLFTAIPIQHPICERIINMNILFAVFSLVPMPNNPGMFIFWYHKYFWGFSVGFILGGVALLKLLGPFYALIGCGLTGLVGIFYYFISTDQMLEFRP